MELGKVKGASIIRYESPFKLGKLFRFLGQSEKTKVEVNVDQGAHAEARSRAALFPAELLRAVTLAGCPTPSRPRPGSSPSCILGVAVAVYARVIQHLARDGGKVRTDDFAPAGAAHEPRPRELLRRADDHRCDRSATAKARRGEHRDTSCPVRCSSSSFAVGHRRLPPLSPPPAASRTLFGLDQVRAARPSLGWAVRPAPRAPSRSPARPMRSRMLAAARTSSRRSRSSSFSANVARAGRSPRPSRKSFVAGVIIAPGLRGVSLPRLFLRRVETLPRPARQPVSSPRCSSPPFTPASPRSPASSSSRSACTLAYERTGSLLVPIGMHALFNFTSLLVLYVQARFPVSPRAVKRALAARRSPISAKTGSSPSSRAASRSARTCASARATIARSSAARATRAGSC